MQLIMQPIHILIAETLVKMLKGEQVSDHVWGIIDRKEVSEIVAYLQKEVRVD